MNRARITAGFVSAVIATAAPCALYFEGIVPHTYSDPVGIPTACVGETGPDIRPGMTFTIDDCLSRFDKRLRLEWSRIEPCINADLAPNEAAAILSWEYNVGATAACRSTLIRMVNAGAPPNVWCAQLSQWTKATKFGVKVELPGLVKRRATERALCEGRGLPAAVSSALKFSAQVIGAPAWAIAA